jgi:hypothetical protein
LADNAPEIRGFILNTWGLRLRAPNPEQLAFGTITTIYSIESFRELLPTRSKRAMTALR